MTPPSPTKFKSLSFVQPLRPYILFNLTVALGPKVLIFFFKKNRNKCWKKKSYHSHNNAVWNEFIIQEGLKGTHAAMHALWFILHSNGLIFSLHRLPSQTLEIHLLCFEVASLTCSTIFILPALSFGFFLHSKILIIYHLSLVPYVYKISKTNNMNNQFSHNYKCPVFLAYKSMDFLKHINMRYC